MEGLKKALEAGASLDARTLAKGETPLHLACRYSRVKAVAYLLGHSADPNAQVRDKDVCQDISKVLNCAGFRRQYATAYGDWQQLRRVCRTVVDTTKLPTGFDGALFRLAECNRDAHCRIRKD